MPPSAPALVQEAVRDEVKDVAPFDVRVVLVEELQRA
jgi:hypothetical protein